MRMTVVTDAVGDLTRALDSGTGLAVTSDPGLTLAALPAAVIGPPRLTWESGNLDPTEATFIVYLVVDADQYAIERMLDLVTEVSNAVDQFMPNAAVTQADPGVFPSGAEQLPCYDVQIEVSL